MARGWAIGVAVLAASVGCAAIVGLQDPSAIDEAPVDGAVVDSMPTTDAGTEAAVVAPEIGYGSGSEGAVVVNDRKSVNESAPLAASANGGARSITLERRDASASTIKAGDVLLLVQSALPGVKPPVNTSPLDTDVGTWELVQVKAVNGDVVDLAGPLVHAFSAPGAQAVRVLQATTVNVAADGGEISGQRWDGTSGGIIAILATESVILNGRIEATNFGFRGAKAVQVASLDGCSPNEGLVTSGFAPKGEGFGAGDAGFGGPNGGRGNAANGGGGGNCHNGGGAGGGNGGRGGTGGNAEDNLRAVGGIGGSALNVPAGVARLRFGGGGGAGEANDVADGNGGPGGGVVFVRAPKLTGNGFIYARGGAGTLSAGDGAGGGGAGGTVYLDLAEAPVCQKILVTGAGGGDCSAFDHGPGGGGGGGLVFLKGGMATTCPIELQAGAAGVEGNSANFGAGPPDNQRSSAPYVGIVSTALAP